ncbi:MAG: IPExxxVDY family protein [Flavobacteriaceae bacterium]|nr:IPExxxVDY family protein [Flavobacteriaceae bacterium]
MPKKKYTQQRPERLRLEFTEEFWLVAVQSQLEIFELVYHINYLMHSHFARTDDDIVMGEMKKGWPIYRWQFSENAPPEYIFSNHLDQMLSPEDNTLELLKDLQTPWFKKVYLLTQFKQVDFFIKLHDQIRGKIFESELKKIQGVTLSFLVSMMQIKNPRLLIFE